MTQPRIDYSLGEYQSAFNSALEKIRQDNVIERIRAKDYTLWKPRPDEIANRLGWLEAPAETLSKAEYILTTIQPFIRDTDDIVLLGIGGSSLAAEVFGKIFGSKPGYPGLHVVDTTDPVIISGITQMLNLQKSLFIVSSKSGTTLEITSLFKYFYNLAHKKWAEKAGGRFIFITDEGSPLVKTAEKISARHVFLNNPDIGGRYSALSLTGIVPAALIGMDIQKMLQRVVSQMEGLSRAGASLGAALGMLSQKGRDKLTLILPPHWKHFGDWLEQLIAESTGKEGKGILPVLNESITDKSTYEKDRFFVIFRNKENIKSFESELFVKDGHPIITININDNYDLGAQMFMWEMATAVACHFLGVNPFDQPDVEASKKHTRAVISDVDKNNKATDEKPALSFKQSEIFGNISGVNPADIIANFLKQGKTGDYVCLQIYLSPTPETDSAVHSLRENISRKYSLPVTCGYGPRYLHSTGQLHKGDAGNGLFIQLTQDNPADIDIPDEAGHEKSSLSFGDLQAAQAEGDFQALTDARRRIIRFHFRTNPVEGIENIVRCF